MDLEGYPCLRTEIKKSFGLGVMMTMSIPEALSGIRSEQMDFVWGKRGTYVLSRKMLICFCQLLPRGT